MAAQKQLLKLWELNNHRPSECVTLRLECCQFALRHLSLYVLTCQRHQVSSVESYRLLVQQQRMLGASPRYSRSGGSFQSLLNILSIGIAEGDAKKGRYSQLRGSVQQRAVANLKAVLCMAAMVKSIYISPLAQGLLDSQSFGA